MHCIWKKRWCCPDRRESGFRKGSPTVYLFICFILFFTSYLLHRLAVRIRFAVSYFSTGLIVLGLLLWTCWHFIYRKIPKISPGYFSKAFFEGLIFGGAYVRRGLSTEGNLRFKIGRASLIVGSKFTIFALFYLSNSTSEKACRKR